MATNQAGSYRVLVSNAAGSALSQAAALTVFNVATPLRLSAPQSTPRGFTFRITASPGRTCFVETSSDLLHWIPLSSVITDAGGTALYSDGATNRAPAFYRVRTTD